MTPYVFHLGTDETPAPGTILRFTLASDLDASVRAFDLLRSHGDCDWVVVAHEGDGVLKRSRVGEKQALVWLRPGRSRGPAAEWGKGDTTSSAESAFVGITTKR